MRVLGRALLAPVSLLGTALLALLRATISLASRSRVALVCLVAAAVILVGGVVDFGLNYGKAYPGVRVGEVDASGKTAGEIEALIDQTYAPRLASSSAVVYANEDAEARVNDEMAAAQNAALAEQLAVEEAQANKLAWPTDASSLGATLPARALAEEAVEVGRSDGGFFARIAALFAGRSIDPRADYGADPLEQLASDIDATIGKPRVDFNVAVTDGVASVTEGYDGSMVDRAAFKKELDRVLLAQENGQGSFIAHAEHAPLRIDAQAAQRVADAVNRAIGDGARFAYGDSAWSASAADMGDWIATRIDEREGGFALTAFVDESRAKPSLLMHVEKDRQERSGSRDLRSERQRRNRQTDGTGTMPLVSDAVRQLNDALFGETRQNFGGASGLIGCRRCRASSHCRRPGPATLSFDEAVDLGIVGTIASYTTEFTTGVGTENRNHNINLVSQLLSNSIVKPGSSWSFNQTAGSATRRRGFWEPAPS